MTSTSQRCATDGCSRAPYARGMCCAHYKLFLKARPRGAVQPRRAAAEAEPALTARMSLPEFLASLAAACPPLPGASCRGRAELFDRTVWERGRQKDTHQARAEALAVCHACPAQTACRAWLDSLPPDQRPIGVVAGQIVAENKSPNRKRADT